MRATPCRTLVVASPGVMPPRPCRVQAVIERPAPVPWVGVVPFPEPVDYWSGTLLAWRWLDPGAGLWTGLVQYRRDGLTYLHWVSGELLDVHPVDA
jgi:hypothetical protein